MVKYKILFLFIVNVIVSPLHGADWASRRHLYTQGLFDSLPVEHQAYSPVMGMGLLEGDLGKKIYDEGAKTPRGLLAKNLLHSLNGNLRQTALKGNPFYSITPKEFGVLVKMLIEGETVDSFMSTQEGEKWLAEHGDRGGIGLSKFKNSIKKQLKPLNNMTIQDKAYVLSMFAAAMSKKPQDLVDYIAGLTGKGDLKIPEKTDLSVVVDAKKITVERLVSFLIDTKLSSYQKLNPRDQLYIDYKDHKKLPLCSEQAVWGFINIVLYNVQKDQLDLSMLPESVVVKPELRGFIEKYKNINTFDYYENAKFDFMDLVSEIPDVYYVDDQDYELETDMQTAFDVIKYLFNLSVETIEGCGESLSTDARTVSLEERDESLLYVTVVDKDKDYYIEARWYFQKEKEHAYLELIISDKKNVFSFLKTVIDYETAHPEIPLASLAPHLFESALKVETSKNRAALLERMLSLPSFNFNVLYINAIPLLQFLIEDKDFKSAQLLLNHGADIDSIEYDYYVSNNMYEIVAFLIDNGVDALEILQSALYRGCLDVSQKENHKNMLIKAAQKVMPEDLNGALDWGIANDRPSSVEMILSDESLQSKINCKNIKELGVKDQ